MMVPLESFAPSGRGAKPDFNNFTIVDGGLTLKFGKYESTVDVVLYEHDAEYRKNTKRRQRENDDSFGASLRRLRLLKHLRQTDFAPEISEREIRRIEANEVIELHQQTQDALARKLGVRFSKITSY